MAPFLLANFLATLYFALYLYGGRNPPYTYKAKYDVARKLAKKNGAIIYTKVYPTWTLPHLFIQCKSNAKANTWSQLEYKKVILFV